MATHGRSGLSRWLLGSVAEKVLRATSNPLFLGAQPSKIPAMTVCRLDRLLFRWMAPLLLNPF